MNAFHTYPHYNGGIVAVTINTSASGVLLVSVRWKFSVTKYENKQNPKAWEIFNKSPEINRPSTPELQFNELSDSICT
jgi:hypothetical protein